MKYLLTVLLCLSLYAESAIVFNSGVTIANRCTQPISFDVIEPHTNSSATCQLGGTVDNPDSWAYLCEFTQVSVLLTATYDSQDYHFDTGYTAKQGAGCYFYNCNDDPLQIHIMCVSNSIGVNSTIEFDAKHDSVSETTP